MKIVLMFRILLCRFINVVPVKIKIYICSCNFEAIINYVIMMGRFRYDPSLNYYVVPDPNVGYHESSYGYQYFMIEFDSSKDHTRDKAPLMD